MSLSQQRIDNSAINAQEYTSPQLEGKDMQRYPENEITEENKQKPNLKIVTTKPDQQENWKSSLVSSRKLSHSQIK